jgi:hypothetical protein
MTTDPTPTPASFPLTAAIEGDQLVIRIGLETLKAAAEHCPELSTAALDDPPYATVVDKRKLAEDVITEMTRGDTEDGSTLLSRLFDASILNAFECGSEAFLGDDDE